MKKIEVKTESKYLYVGAFHFSEAYKKISFFVGEPIVINIQNAVDSFKMIESKISLIDLKQICIESNIKATIYPSGNIGFSKLDSSDDELKTCYLSIASTSNNDYVICIALDETQPMLYKAQLVSVFLIENKS